MFRCPSSTSEKTASDSGRVFPSCAFVILVCKAAKFHAGGGDQSGQWRRAAERFSITETNSPEVPLVPSSDKTCSPERKLPSPQAAG